ncbi:MAG: hypothetical protein IKE02_03815 [Lachnospiraceae bacterium]|nr:hypothetical protein [Lachnospiraceae bacterium]
MAAYTDLGIKIDDLLSINGDELRILINHAITDMITDTMSRYKDKNAKRKITIDIELSRIDTQLYVGWKVTPKPAPYERKPEEAKIPEGQTSLFNEETGEVEDD